MAYKNIKIKRLNEAAGSYQGRNPDGSFIRQPRLPALDTGYDPSIGLAGERPAREKFNTLLDETSSNIMHECGLEDDSDVYDDRKDIIEMYLKRFANEVVNRFTRRNLSHLP